MAFTSARELDTVGEADSVTSEVKTIETYHTAGGGAVLGVALAPSLIAVGIARHPVSIQGTGGGLLLTDIGLLLAYGIVGICVWYQRRADVGIALRVGMLAGLVLGMLQAPDAAAARVKGEYERH
jgi:hypothetical protein